MRGLERSAFCVADKQRRSGCGSTAGGVLHAAIKYLSERRGEEDVGKCELNNRVSYEKHMVWVPFQSIHRIIFTYMVTSVEEIIVLSFSPCR